MANHKNCAIINIDITLEGDAAAYFAELLEIAKSINVLPSKLIRTLFLVGLQRVYLDIAKVDTVIKSICSKEKLSPNDIIKLFGSN